MEKSEILDFIVGLKGELKRCFREHIDIAVDEAIDEAIDEVLNEWESQEEPKPEG